MRKVYLIIALILFTVNLFSQDVEPIPFDFTYRFEGQEDTINYVNQPLDPDDFRQKDFQTVWMWSTNFKLARATKSDVFFKSIILYTYINYQEITIDFRLRFFDAKG